METDVDVEIRKTGFPHRLQNACWRFAQFPQARQRLTTKPKGWAKSDDQSGPNQVDKTTAYRETIWNVHSTGEMPGIDAANRYPGEVLWKRHFVPLLKKEI
jgi:hypothetical protein